MPNTVTTLWPLWAPTHQSGSPATLPPSWPGKSSLQMSTCIWGKICEFPHILRSPFSYMTLHPIPSEFPYLKVHKHEIILIFFLPKSNPYMPFVNCRKKFRFFSFDFCQNFDVRTFPRWLSIRGAKFFLRDIQQIFFFKIFTLVLLDRFLDCFSKFGFFIGKICILIRDFWVILENYSMRMLSIRGNDFIACWA